MVPDVLLAALTQFFKLQDLLKRWYTLVGWIRICKVLDLVLKMCHLRLFVYGASFDFDLMIYLVVDYLFVILG